MNLRSSTSFPQPTPVLVDERRSRRASLSRPFSSPPGPPQPASSCGPAELRQRVPMRHTHAHAGWPPEDVELLVRPRDRSGLAGGVLWPLRQIFPPAVSATTIKTQRAALSWINPAQTLPSALGNSLPRHLVLLPGGQARLPTWRHAFPGPT